MTTIEDLMGTVVPPEAAQDTEAVSEVRDDDNLPEPVLNGLEFADIRRLVLEKNETLISKDDPICIVITIFQAALERADEANSAHVRILKEEVDAAVLQLRDEVDKSVKPLTEIALNTQIAALLENARQESSSSTKIHTSMRRLAVWLGFCALVVASAGLVSLALLLK